MVVELRRAGIPFLGWIAAHYWFVLRDGGRCERWEVWQTKNAGGQSVGHLHCNLKPPEADVGGGPTQLVAEWSGEQALALIRIFSEQYPYCDTYRYWPGPNSNTYVAWVLREAGIAYPLGRMAIGSRFLR
jgi:Protein of unknown function (DUF3750)